MATTTLFRPSLKQPGLFIQAALCVRSRIVTQGIHNLTKTTDYVVSVVSEAQRNNRKVVCFVTGIPGAGETLAGLNVVHSGKCVLTADRLQFSCPGTAL